MVNSPTSPTVHDSIGWRLDAAYAVPRPFWRQVMAGVRAKHPDAYVFGEVIHAAPNPSRNSFEAAGLAVQRAMLTYVLRVMRGVGSALQ